MTATAQPLPALDCVIKPYVVVDVGTPVAGVIDALEVDRNDLVEAGDVVARLKSDVEQATVALAKARSEVNGRVESRRAALAFGERKLKRTDELYVKKAVPFHLKDEAETDARIAKLKLQEAKEEKLIAQLELQRAVEMFNQRTIRSPISGVVVERLAFPGEFVDDKPILRLAQLDPLLVEVIVPVNMFGTIRTGMHARVATEIANSERYSATVTSVDRVVDGSSGTFGVRLELRNPDYHLPGGLKCSLTLLDEPPEPAAVERFRETPSSLQSGPAPEVVETEATTEPEMAVAAVPGPGPNGSPRPRTATAPSGDLLAASSGPVCRSIGPLESTSRAEKLTQALSPRVTRINRRVEGPTQVTRYMVVTPRQESMADAERLAKRLRALGLQHPWVVPKGEMQARVSLGLFLSKAKAEEQRAALAAKGVKVEIKPRHRSQTRIWLDLEVPGRDLAGIQTSILKTQPGLSVKPAACPPLKTAQR